MNKVVIVGSKSVALTARGRIDLVPLCRGYALATGAATISVASLGRNVRPKGDATRVPVPGAVSTLYRGLRTASVPPDGTAWAQARWPPGQVSHR